MKSDRAEIFIGNSATKSGIPAITPSIKRPIVFPPSSMNLGAFPVLKLEKFCDRLSCSVGNFWNVLHHAGDKLFIASIPAC